MYNRKGGGGTGPLASITGLRCFKIPLQYLKIDHKIDLSPRRKMIGLVLGV